MSSALDSPQGSNSNETLPKLKFRIRWRLMLAGFCLLALGLALHFALNYYYSSSYSQVSDSKSISGSHHNKTNSLKLRFRKKPEAEAKELSQPDDFEKTSYAASAGRADTISPSALESNYPEASKTSTALPNSSRASQIQLEMTLSASVVRTQCPSGSRPLGMKCGNTQVTVSTKGGRPPYRYSVSGGHILGQGQSQTTWDLSDAQPGNYSITVVGSNGGTKKGLRVETCKCISLTPTPKPTASITPSPTPKPTQNPPNTPTPKPSATPVPTPTREKFPTPIGITP